MLRASLVVAVAVLLAGFAQAAPLCTPGANVLSLTSPCALDGGMVVGDWSVGVVGFTSASVYLSPLSSGNDIVFQLTTSPLSAPASGADIIVQYYVYSPLVEVDLDMTQGTSYGEVGIIENVYDGQNNLVAQLAVQNGGTMYMAAPVTGEGPFRIRKDIQFGSGARLSDFTNSHEIPEPSTYLLMGTGLLAVGFARRRWARK